MHLPLNSIAKHVNRTLFLAEALYDNLNKLCQSIFDNDQKAAVRYIDSQELSVVQADDLINALFTSINLTESDIRFNTCGFKRDGDYLDIYMKLVDNKVTSFFRFDFNKSTRRLCKFSKLSSTGNK